MEVFNVKKYKDRHNLSRTLLATLESTGLTSVISHMLVIS